MSSNHNNSNISNNNNLNNSMNKSNTSNNNNNNSGAPKGSNAKACKKEAPDSVSRCYVFLVATVSLGLCFPCCYGVFGAMISLFLWCLWGYDLVVAIIY